MDQTSYGAAHHHIEVIDGGPFRVQVAPDTLGVAGELAVDDVADDVAALRSVHEVY